MSNGPRISNILVSYHNATVGTAEIQEDGTLTMKLHPEIVGQIRQTVLLGDVGSIEITPKFIPAILPESGKTHYVPEPRESGENT